MESWNPAASTKYTNPEFSQIETKELYQNYFALVLKIKK